MQDPLRAVFNVERPLHEVWRACAAPAAGASFRLPAFPALDGKPGCPVTVLEADPQRLLRLRKDGPPCAGTEIVVAIAPATAAGWPTRVTLEQGGFAAGFASPAAIEAHFRQIAADFRLFLSHEVEVPGTVFTDFGAEVTPTATGLRVDSVAEGAFAAAAGLRPGDVLLTVGPIRIHSIEQLWTTLALLPGGDVPMTWVRDGSRAEGTAPLAARPAPAPAQG